MTAAQPVCLWWNIDIHYLWLEAGGGSDMREGRKAEVIIADVFVCSYTYMPKLYLQIFDIVHNKKLDNQWLL